MVTRVRRAGRRSFSAKNLAASKGVYNWRRVSGAIIQAMLLLVQCTNVVAEVPLERKSSVQIRAELRSKLAASLAAGKMEVAFAKSCGITDVPRADDPETMLAAFPGKDKINWDAKPTKSGLNVSLWQFWHARHCNLCTHDQVHDKCYFKTLKHFLLTGFDPPESEGCSMTDACPTRVAYVDKWREEEQRCRDAFAKWEADASGLMSHVVSSTPHLVFPLLPVVRAKDAWRHSRTGVDYKVRLCFDFKNGGMNGMLDDWKFQYWGLESVAETVSQGDWLASIDISRFYLRLPAGEKLRNVQWFQDPSSFGEDTNANERLRESRRKFRQLCSVAFGLKSAPAFASVVSAEVKRILQSFGISVAGVYLDDFLICGATKRECKENLKKACAILAALGILPNDKTKGPCAPEADEGIVFLGVHIKTSDCSMTVTEEHRKYAVDRITTLLDKKSASVKELESVGGILSWISQVFIPGRPRRNAVFEAIHRLNASNNSTARIRGELCRQLQWWQHVLTDDTIPASSHFWVVQPDTPLMCRVMRQVKMGGAHARAGSMW